MSKINLSLQVIPNVADELVYPVVDKVIAMIEESGLTYEVGPMETTIEGELDELMEIVKKAQYVCVKEGATRVISMVKIDYKPEGVTINEKIGKYRTEKEVQRT
ncbi:MAG: thiamine-binding protein [Clostridiaceae bacterium]|nr:thiamine-binding protein [Clostridiaceae bacterium]